MTTYSKRSFVILIIGAFVFLTGCQQLPLSTNSSEDIQPSVRQENHISFTKTNQQYDTLIDALSSEENLLYSKDFNTIQDIALNNLTTPSHTIDILISAVGDCTLGTDETFSYTEPFYTFDEIFQQVNQRYSYFFENVYDYVGFDDLTIANLETTLTNETAKADKKFRFKGPQEYTNILTDGSIEAVNLANNHSMDYLKQGFEDTKEALTDAQIIFFEESNSVLYDVKGIKIGLIGLRGWFDNETTKTLIKNEINELKNLDADYIIISFHWGIDRQYEPYDVQINLAHFSIDQGADLVLGHHPHVLQGIETYQNKQIVYSLGNFVFGGNHNPEDYDTMVYQQKLTFDVTTINEPLLLNSQYVTIPCSISSLNEYNDFRPTPYEGEEQIRAQQKIDDLSNF